MEPSDRIFLLTEAMRCLNAGQWQQVDRFSRLVLESDAEDQQALLLSGLALAAMGERRRAAPLLNRIARARPDCRHPCRDLAALGERVPPSEVIEQYRACLDAAPDDSRLRRDFADFLLDHAQAAEAAAVLSTALDTATAHNLMGMAQAGLGNVKAAITQFESVILSEPGLSTGWTNLGMMLKIDGRYDAAVHAYNQALRLAPDDPRVQVNRAVALLHAGEWSEAWQHYEARLRLGQQSWPAAERMLPTLDGMPSLQGQTVLALHEDGFGDTIQFMRYLPLLAGRGARVIAAVPPQLTRLVERLPGVAAVCQPGEISEPYDWWVPMFSLPRVFGTTVDTVPNDPYVCADPALTAEWSARLPAGAVRAGLVWAGQARPWLPDFALLDRRRSAGLKPLRPLFEVPGVTWVSLQKDGVTDGTPLFDPMPAMPDFFETAAIIANLDVVVSVDTAAVHLAAAMGKPTFLLDRYDNCWRWLSGRTDSPWYPSLKIFRQTRQDDWSEPVEDVCRALLGMTIEAKRRNWVREAA